MSRESWKKRGVAPKVWKCENRIMRLARRAFFASPKTSEERVRLVEINV